MIPRRRFECQKSAEHSHRTARLYKHTHLRYCPLDSESALACVNDARSASANIRRRNARIVQSLVGEEAAPFCEKTC